VVEPSIRNRATEVRKRLAVGTRIRPVVLRANPVLEKAGLFLKEAKTHSERFPTADFPDWWQSIIERVRPYTLTGPGTARGPNTVRRTRLQEPH
jgi:hypothetical protein